MGDAADERDKLDEGASFPIVGVGASAGGLEAFTQLLKGLPLDTGMGVVLCSISIRSTKAYFGFFRLDETTVARPRELGRKFPFSHALASAANNSQVNDER